MGNGIGPSFLRPLLQAPASAWTLRDRSTDQRIAKLIFPALDRSTRNRGLLGRSSLPADTAMVLAPCSSVHTFFMKFSIDILFVSRAGEVMKLRRNFPPWRFTFAAGAFAVIELPAGAASAAGVFVGDHLVITPPES